MLIAILAGLVLFAANVIYLARGVIRIDTINHVIMEMNYLAVDIEYNKQRFIEEGNREYSNAVFSNHNLLTQNAMLIDFSLFQISDQAYMTSILDEIDSYDEAFNLLEGNLSQIVALKLILHDQMESYQDILQDSALRRSQEQQLGLKNLQSAFDVFQIGYLNYNNTNQNSVEIIENIDLMILVSEDVMAEKNTLLADETSMEIEFDLSKLSILGRSIKENFIKYASKTRETALTSETLSHKSRVIEDIIQKMVTHYNGIVSYKVNQVTIILSLLLTTIFIASLSISIYLRKLVTSNLQRVGEATQKIAKGEINTRITPITKDEFGQLASSINHMADALEISAIEMKELNEQLEDKVTVRTNELNEAKKALEAINQQLIAEKVRLIEIASTDELTGLFNRRAIIRTLDEQIKISARYQRPLTIMIVDIDHFKNINDQYGHIAGDEVLKKLALIFMSSIRNVDYVGRFGGEEFIFVFPNTSLEDSKHLIERIRSEVISSKFTLFNIQLTFSGGVSEYVEGTSMELIHLADKRLYLAKESGRNRILYD